MTGGGKFLEAPLSKFQLHQTDGLQMSFSIESSYKKSPRWRSREQEQNVGDTKISSLPDDSGGAQQDDD